MGVGLGGIQTPPTASVYHSVCGANGEGTSQLARAGAARQLARAATNGNQTESQICPSSVSRLQLAVRLLYGDGSVCVETSTPMMELVEQPVSSSTSYATARTSCTSARGQNSISTFTRTSELLESVTVTCRSSSRPLSVRSCASLAK